MNSNNLSLDNMLEKRPILQGGFQNMNLNDNQNLYHNFNQIPIQNLNQSPIQNEKKFNINKSLPLQISNQFSVPEHNNLNSSENEYVIYDCFKNMLNKNKISKNSISDGRIDNNRKAQENENYTKKEDKFSPDFYLYKQNFLNSQGSSFSCNNLHNQIQSMNLDNNYDRIEVSGSLIKELNSSEYDQENKIKYYNQSNQYDEFNEHNQNHEYNEYNQYNQNNQFDPNNQDSNLYSYHNYNEDLQEILFSQPEISNKITDDKYENTRTQKKVSKQKKFPCKSANCKFFTKKYTIYKKSSQNYRKKYLKEKRLNEILNLKLFYHENNKFQPSNTQSDKLNSTNVSSTKDDETKLTKMVFEKLQENYMLFEKLENEIINKDATIEKQGETIIHLKSTIDKLLEQFNVFTAQGNYLINDLLILKQNVYDKNFKEVTKEFDEIGLTINDYTNRIKEFSDKTKSIIKEEESLEIPSENKIKKLKTIPEEISEATEQNESVLSFTLSRSNMKHSNTTSNMDRSLRLMDLSSNFFINSLIDNQILNFNTFKEEEI